MTLKISKDADITWVDKDILKDEDFLPENMRIRISMMVPVSVLDHFRDKAKKKGIGYQTLMNQVLKEYCDKDQSLEERVEKLEEEVFKKDS